MIAPLLLASLMQVQSGTFAPSADSVEALRQAAHKAEQRFERLARQLAPLRYGASSGGDCDEIVGRFCLTYDEGHPTEPEPEPSEVTQARRLAIEALRRSFTYSAGELTTSAPLVRYLVEDDRAREAVSAARTYDALSADSVWGPMLTGFALHAAGEDTAAERLFSEAIERLPAADRDRIRDVTWLLSDSDRGLYDDLTDAGRRRFERGLWRFSDPLYLTPGNESWNQHVARYVWARALERAPVVAGMLRWGKDLEELTLRYGVPTSRTRTPAGSFGSTSLVEHYDPGQLAYVPADLLTRGPPPTPPPGESWVLENPRNRTGFAPVTLRRLIPMDVQVTRFPCPTGQVLRVDGAFLLDSLAANADSVDTGMFVLDADWDIAAERLGSARPAGDTVRFDGEVELYPGDYVYSLEALDPASRLGGRARYAVTIDSTSGGLAVSDVLIADPYPAGSPLPRNRIDPVLRPRARLDVQTGDTLGLYAEVAGLAPGPDGRTEYRIELALERAHAAALPARVVSWLGDKLGLSDPEHPTRLAWTATGAGTANEPIAVNLRVDASASTLYIVRLRVTDLVSGRQNEGQRLLRVIERN